MRNAKGQSKRIFAGHALVTNTQTLQCSEGMPCKRCVENDLKGVSMYFPCDRSKLPDLVFDFLPRKNPFSALSISY